MTPLSIGFYGAAGTVTGSKFLVQSGETRVLVDCGMFQGLKELRLQNWEDPPFDPRTIDAVLLTHAHIDHSGYLPRLVRQGFNGPIYSTPATADLARILLLDAAKIQEEDAAYANRKGFSKHRPALPLFDTRDAIAAINLLKPVAFGGRVDVGPLWAWFHQAGHILGSAFVELSAPGDDRPLAMVFSGDLGRIDRPLHLDPAPLPPCDILVLESTYGDRLHQPATLDEQVAVPFRRALDRGGTILIPAFAVARAQLMTMELRRLMEDGQLPTVPVHLDSPMAVDVTETYLRYLDTGDLDPVENGARDLFPDTIRFHRSIAESKQLNTLQGPRIIISSSGMLTGGRVLHHLERLLPDKRNLVALVGYQAPGTRGRRLLEGERSVRMHGREVPAHAEIVNIEGLSAHADRAGLLDWVATASSPPHDIFLAHGEPPALESLAAAFHSAGRRVHVPAMGDIFTFRADAWRKVPPSATRS